MKKILLMLLLMIPVISFSQDTISKTRFSEEFSNADREWIKLGYDELSLGFVGSLKPSHSIIINGSNNKQLYLDFNGDSLKVSGELKMDEAAVKFIKFVQESYTKSIFKLNSDSTIITFNGNKYFKNK